MLRSAPINVGHLTRANTEVIPAPLPGTRHVVIKQPVGESITNVPCHQW